MVVATGQHLCHPQRGEIVLGIPPGLPGGSEIDYGAGENRGLRSALQSHSPGRCAVLVVSVHPPDSPKSKPAIESDGRPVVEPNVQRNGSEPSPPEQSDDALQERDGDAMTPLPRSDRDGVNLRASPVVPRQRVTNDRAADRRHEKPRPVGSREIFEEQLPVPCVAAERFPFDAQDRGKVVMTRQPDACHCSIVEIRQPDGAILSKENIACRVNFVGKRICGCD